MTERKTNAFGQPVAEATTQTNAYGQPKRDLWGESSAPPVKRDLWGDPLKEASPPKAAASPAVAPVAKRRIVASESEAVRLIADAWLASVDAQDMATRIAREAVTSIRKRSLGQPAVLAGLADRVQFYESRNVAAVKANTVAAASEATGGSKPASGPIRLDEVRR